MFLLARIAAFFGLWLYTRRRSVRQRSLDLGMSRLSWRQRIDLVWRLSRDSRIPPPLRALIWIPAIYMVSPIDLVPDFIPFLGRLDDSVIYSLVTDLMVRMAPIAVIEEHIAAVTGGPRAA